MWNSLSWVVISSEKELEVTTSTPRPVDRDDIVPLMYFCDFKVLIG